MNSATPVPGEPLVDLVPWYERWERQQATYIPLREERFTVMLDTVEHIAGDAPVVLDLLSGPGAISARVLKRFPRARVYALDLDPVLMAIGKAAHGDAGGRLTWLEANVKDPDWVRVLPPVQFDAVLSTTAIHWLEAGDIVELYRALAVHIRPGGVFMNGDQMRFPARDQVLRGLTEAMRSRHEQASQQAGGETWEHWWAELRKLEPIGPLFEERDRRFRWRNIERERAIGSTRDDANPRQLVSSTYPIHHAALLDAGFSEVHQIWQFYDNRILAAVR
ncbi:class I SAM-dependent methyltransferase [Tepidiforma sp.]|uniref:class I SAM-dependent methyltransferase n=1 Tax=Tepidiforma sp. TaxID=2682230 RepID=UPI002ADE110E|nr:methyltransferase domain-containing protein [Tepidiforma sp.]